MTTPAKRLGTAEPFAFALGACEVIAGWDLGVAAITVAELWHGVERAGTAQRSRRLTSCRRCWRPCPSSPYTHQTALEHARIWAQLEVAGKMIGAYDSIVAATALERGSEVATFNQRHFAVVPGLRVIKPG